MSELLLSGAMPFKQIGKPKLVESSGHTVLRVEGVFQNYTVINENGRRYPKPVWDNVLSEGSDFNTRLGNRAVLGMIEHPEDGITRLDKASHVVVEARYATPKEIASNPELEEGDILGAYETLPTPEGKILEALLMANVQFGVSSRGNGTVSETADCVDVNDDFILETWDAVFSPSVVRAIPRIRTESVITPNTINALIEEEEDDDDKDEKGKADKDYNSYVNSHNIPMSRGQWDSYNSNQKRMKNKSDTKEESSFVLATGIMNQGEQLIPIQLIAESSQFRWYNCNSCTALQGVAAADSMVEAFSTFTKFCEQHGYQYQLPLLPESTGKEDPVPVGGTVTESKDPMNALTELNKVKAGVIQLRQTETKKLKPSDKVCFFEAIADYRVELSALQESHPHIKVNAKSVFALLEEFEDELNDGPAEEVDGPPVEPDLDAPMGDEPGLDDEGGTDEEIAQMADVLDQAAAKLDAACAEDPECQELADELRDISADLDPVGDDFEPEPGVEDDFDGEFEDDIPMESRRKILRTLRESKRGRRKGKILSRTERRFRLLQRRHTELKEAASKLLKKYKESKVGGDNSPESRKGLIERSQRFEEAAKELAGRYNQDMTEIGAAYIKLKRPDLWEAHGEKLLKCKTFEAFTKLSEKLVAKYPDPAALSESVEEETEKSADTSKETPLGESAEKDKSSPDKKGALEESHPALSMVGRARRNGSRYNG